MIMKKIFFSLVILVGMISCQVIKPEDRYLKMEDAEVGERNVVLMDFTGWQCVNCPNAAEVANGLITRYGSHVIVVSMHPKGSTFTEPGTSGPDFATDEAMNYLKAYGGSVSTSLPTGIVDGQQYDGSYFLNYQSWAGAVTDRLKVDVEYSMEMKASTTSCTVNLTKNGYDSRNVNVVIWLLEDSIIAPQLKKKGSETEVVKDYAHRHVFRKCLNGSDIWGESVEFEGDEATVEATYKLPQLQGENFVIVAVAVDAETHEVLQAEEVELKEHGGDHMFEITDNDGKVLKDGDTLLITHYDEMLGQMGFYGYFNSKYADEHDFTIVEHRDFDYSVYTVTMCVFGNCRPDSEEHPGEWGPYTFDGLSENDFQSHVTIPYDSIAVPVELHTTYDFSDGATTISIPVVFRYTPE